MPIYITANVEFRCIIDKIMTIIESLELNQSVAFASADEVHNARNVAYDIISICEEDSKFEITLKKFSQLHEAMNAAYNTDDDPIMHAFNSVLLIFEAVERNLEKYADEIVTWKNKAQKAEKALNNQKKLNENFNATIVRYRNTQRCMDKENHELRVARDCSAEVIYAIRNAIFNRNSDAFNCIESRMRNDSDFNSDPFMAGIKENIIDICAAEKKNIANHDLKNSEIARLANKNDKRKEILELRADISRLLKEKEMYKRIANSVYGIGMPSRCNGKQMFCDITTGKKILIDKEKYDDLMECVNNISLTYEMMKLTPFSMDRPLWLSGIINRIEDLTK
jgi:DNA repair ATPase RecN